MIRIHWSIRIKGTVPVILADKGLGKEGKEPAVSLMLHHLYVAMDIYRYMTQEEKNKAGYWFRLFKSSYTLRNFLKERKRKRDKEKSPLHPSYKERETELKEKAQKPTHTLKREFSASFEERREAFRKECFAYEEEYNSAFITDFYNWFSEPSEDGEKMRFEEQRYFSVKNRLKKWSQNSVASEKAAAAAKAQFVKGKAVEGQGKAQQKTQSVGVIDAHVLSDNAIGKARREKAADSLEEYLRQHPESQLAKYRGQMK